MKLIDVPAGAFTKPAPSAVVHVDVRREHVRRADRVRAVRGVIWMFASTNVLTASTELPVWPLVWTVIGTPPIESVDVACAVTLPAVGEVKVIVH